MLFLSFQALLETFPRYFALCFDTKKQSSLEEILKWFNIKLVACGQKPWTQQGKKWAIAQSKLKLHTSMWQHRDIPLLS